MKTPNNKAEMKMIDLTDEELEKEISNLFYEQWDAKKIEQYAFEAAKAIIYIAPWISASLSDDACKEYADACEEIFKLDLLDLMTSPDNDILI